MEVIFSILVSILEYILLGKMHSIISQEEVAQPAWQGVEVETSIAVFLPMNQILIRLKPGVLNMMEMSSDCEEIKMNC